MKQNQGTAEENNQQQMSPQSVRTESWRGGDLSHEPSYSPIHGGMN